MRVLITGITGMAGSHLADYLLARGGIEVHGIKRWRSRTEEVDIPNKALENDECYAIDQ